MPHIVKENHLEEICANCKKPHGSNKEIFLQHHKIYSIITCSNCSYEILKVEPESTFTDQMEMFHRI